MVVPVAPLFPRQVVPSLFVIVVRPVIGLVRAVVVDPSEPVQTVLPIALVRHDVALAEVAIIPNAKPIARAFIAVPLSVGAGFATFALLGYSLASCDHAERLDLGGLLFWNGGDDLLCARTKLAQGAGFLRVHQQLVFFDA